MAHPPFTEPKCFFRGSPELAEGAQRFIDATVAQPDLMRQALEEVRVTNTGEFMYGIPGGCEESVDDHLSECIGAMATILNSEADCFFTYDKETKKQMGAPLRNLWEQKRDATGRDEIAIARRLRVARLAVFVGRVADPHGMNAQLWRSQRAA